MKYFALCLILVSGSVLACDWDDHDCHAQRERLEQMERQAEYQREQAANAEIRMREMEEAAERQRNIEWHCKNRAGKDCG